MKKKTNKKLTLKAFPKNPRKRLFQSLYDIITFSENKRLLQGNSDKYKQAWTRIQISAISTYGSLMKDNEIEEINKRLELLEMKKV